MVVLCGSHGYAELISNHVQMMFKVENVSNNAERGALECWADCNEE